MTEARIYQPARTAMQAGQANTRKWVLEFEPAAAKTVDPLMGWTGSVDTREQVHMTFDSRDQAVAFARKNGFTFRVEEPKTPRIRPKNYGDNFRWDGG